MGSNRKALRFQQLACCVLFSLGDASALGPNELPAQTKTVQGILVPVPKEIFRTLDEFQNANWRALQQRDAVRWKSQGDQVQVALLLGVVVAEGFIAMEAQDAKEVKDLGQRVLILARALGVEQAALRRSRSIIDNAERDQWSAARKEWDNVLSDLEKGMIALKSEPLFRLVSLAGWLRGTEALSGLVMQDYSADRANLLRQNAMIDYLERQLRAMNEPARSRPIVVKMLQGLQAYRSLMEADRNSVSQKTVNEVKETCHRLVSAVSLRGT